MTGHMFVIAGLGNKGEKYEGTRHNAGRMAVMHFVDTHSGSFVASGKYAAQIWEGNEGKEKVLAMLPETYMNESGGSVKKAASTKAAVAKLIVLYDDIDLPLGTIRVAWNRGAGGHNGLASVIKSVGSKEFARIRIGVSPNVRGVAKKPKSGEGVLDFVMGEFKKSETKTLEDSLSRAAKAATHIITHGVPSAMNTFNQS